MSAGTIRVGIGGWTYAPWRETFYPPEVTVKGELAYASRQVTAIEINGTFYRTQSADSFAKWHDETPDDFQFAVKAHRVTTHRRVLAEAGEAVERFVGSGLERLGAKLGPLLWQFAPTKAFDAEDFDAFLQLLPRSLGGRRLRHAVEVRHASFLAPEFLGLVRRHGVAPVFADSPKYPVFADLGADFVYARLMKSEPEVSTGYRDKALDGWAEAGRAWAAGGEPAGLPRIDAGPPPEAPRDVYLFFIDGAKERAPAAARALLQRLGS